MGSDGLVREELLLGREEIVDPLHSRLGDDRPEALPAGIHEQAKRLVSQFLQAVRRTVNFSTQIAGRWRWVFPCSAAGGKGAHGATPETPPRGISDVSVPRN